MALSEIDVAPPEGGNLAATQPAHGGQNDRDEHPLASHGFDQIDRLRHVIDLHLPLIDLGGIDGIGGVAVEHFPAHRLLERLFQYAVHVLDGLRRQRALAVVAPSDNALA